MKKQKRTLTQMPAANNNLTQDNANLISNNNVQVAAVEGTISEGVNLNPGPGGDIILKDVQI